MGPVVLDAHPVMELLTDGARAADVQAVLREAQACDVCLPMCVVNWGEVVYNIHARAGERVDDLLMALEALPIATVDADRTLTSRAALIKAGHGLGYADSFAAALAIMLDAPLLTGDPDFLPLQEAGLKLRFLGKGG